MEERLIKSNDECMCNLVANHKAYVKERRNNLKVMVVPIMVLLFFKGKSGKITDNPIEKRHFVNKTTNKKRSTILG